MKHRLGRQRQRVIKRLRRAKEVREAEDRKIAMRLEQANQVCMYFLHVHADDGKSPNEIPLVSFYYCSEEFSRNPLIKVVGMELARDRGSSRGPLREGYVRQGLLTT